MKGNHVTEETLQEYAYDPESCTAETVSHIRQCTTCNMAVTNYRILYNSTAALPDAVFGFDAAELVLLKPERTHTGWILAGIISCVLAITGYLFSSYFAYVMANVTGLPLYIVVTATVTVVTIQLLKTIKNFRQSCNFITGGLSA